MYKYKKIWDTVGHLSAWDRWDGKEFYGMMEWWGIVRDKTCVNVISSDHHWPFSCFFLFVFWLQSRRFSLGGHGSLDAQMLRQNSAWFHHYQCSLWYFPYITWPSWPFYYNFRKPLKTSVCHYHIKLPCVTSTEKCPVSPLFTTSFASRKKGWRSQVGMPKKKAPMKLMRSWDIWDGIPNMWRSATKFCGFDEI